MTIPRRLHQARRILAEHGARGLAARAARRLAVRLDDGGGEPLPVRPADVLAADPRHTPVRRAALPDPGAGPLVVNWVCTPPSAGSGGHTTMMRLVQHLEDRGHLCRIYLYDTFGGRAADRERVLRAAFPAFRGPVADVTEGMADAHAVVATAWMTAYPVHNDPSAGTRVYLVQDYEPWFYPRGDLATLAENTYRMGFHGLTAGTWLAGMLRDRFAMPADGFDFGADPAVYHLDGAGAPRDGVVFYARRRAPRRATELGLMALRIVAERRPDLTIHLYGEPMGAGLGPRVVDHGLVGTGELNAIYNRCSAGLSLSMTNVSLVPLEMLAAGCTPVVNDAEHNRAVLASDDVRYADPTPQDLARAIIETVDAAVSPARLAAGVAGRTWDGAGVVAERVIRNAVGGADQSCADGDVAPATSIVAGREPSAGAV